MRNLRTLSTALLCSALVVCWNGAAVGQVSTEVFTYIRQFEGQEPGDQGIYFSPASITKDKIVEVIDWAKSQLSPPVYNYELVGVHTEGSAEASFGTLRVQAKAALDAGAGFMYTGGQPIQVWAQAKWTDHFTLYWTGPGNAPETPYELFLTLQNTGSYKVARDPIAQLGGADVAGSAGTFSIQVGASYDFSKSFSDTPFLPNKFTIALIADQAEKWDTTTTFKVGGGLLSLGFDIDGGRTLRYESILMADGTTPESHGWRLDFDSGNPSPNLRDPSADFNEDGVIDGSDFLAWQRGSGINDSAVTIEGNANHDGFVDAEDLAIWQTQFGTVVDSTTATRIPEPIAMAQLLEGAVLMTLAMRRIVPRLAASGRVDG